MSISTYDTPNISSSRKKNAIICTWGFQKTMVIDHAYHKKVRFKTLGGLSDRTRTIKTQEYTSDLSKEDKTEVTYRVSYLRVCMINLF